MKKSPVLWSLILVIAAGIFTAVSPLEKTLGVKARLVYFHGAWVWAAMMAFLAAAIMGGAALVVRKEHLHAWSRAWGRAAIVFWWLFLPMSLYMMQLNWGGLFLAEPRWRIPLNYAIVGLFLQIGLSMLPVIWTSIGNLLFAFIFFFSMTRKEAVLHPESAVFSSGSTDIQVFFTIILVLQFLLSWQVARIWFQVDSKPSRSEA